MLVITWFRHPLEKIRALQSKLVSRLGAFYPESLVPVKNIDDLEDRPLRKKGAEIQAPSEGDHHHDEDQKYHHVMSYHER